MHLQFGVEHSPALAQLHLGLYRWRTPPSARPIQVQPLPLLGVKIADNL